MNLVTDFGEYKDIELRAGRFVYDNSLAISIWDMYDDCVAKITTCLDDKTLHEDEAYVDSNNCKWVENFLTQNNIATKLDKVKQSGFCTYQAYKFDLNKLSFDD